MMSQYRISDVRWQFTSIEELVEYVATLTNIEPLSKQSIRMKGSEVGFLRKTGTSNGNVPYKNPVLDHITSPHGEIVIGSQSFLLRARRLGPSRRRIITLEPPTIGSFAPHALSCYDDSSGLEICMSDDGSMITYSYGAASMSFKSYKDASGPYWEMGTEVKTSGLNFEAAMINSRYIGEGYGQTCGVEYDQDSDTQDNYLDEYESGIFAPQPKRVMSLCRVQWHDRRISGVVSAGEECFIVDTIQPWPEGWPEDWPPLNQPDPIQTIAVRPVSLEFTSRPSRPEVTKTITVVSTFLIPKTVTVENAVTDGAPANPNPFVQPNLGGAPVGEFSNVSGQLTIPPNGSLNIPVTFIGESGLGSISGSLRIRWDSREITVGLLGRLVEEVLM